MTESETRTLSFLELSEQLRKSGQPADPMFGASWATTAAPWRLGSWRLPLINGVAVLAIIGAITFRLWEAHLPTYALQIEAVVVAVGVVLAAVGVSIRASRFAGQFAIRMTLAAIGLILAMIGLAVAGPWLGSDLPPIAVVTVATVMLHFDLGLRTRRFSYIFAFAVAGVLVLWTYALTTLMVPASVIAIWTLVLFGLGVLAFLVSRAVDADLTIHVERQSSLLAALSDLGEGLVITQDGKFVAGNDAYVNLTGYSREELAAFRTLIDLAPADDRPQLGDSLAMRLSGGEVPARYLSALIAKDGRRVQVEVAIHRLSVRQNRLLALVNDVTERMRAEESEREIETRFRTLFEQAQAGMVFANLDGHITTVNPAFCQLVGYSDTELRSLSLIDITHPEDQAAMHEAMSGMLAASEEGVRTEKRYTRKDGEVVWVDLTMRLVRGPDGKPLYFQTVAVDIRDRKRAEVLQAARFAVTQALVTSPGWDKAAPGVLEGLCRTLDWELAEYWEVNPERETMHFITSWKRPGRDTTAYEETASKVTYRRGEGLAGRVWESGAPVSMPDLSGDTSMRAPAAVAAGLHGIVGFPVRSGRRVRPNPCTNS